MNVEMCETCGFDRLKGHCLCDKIITELAIYKYANIEDKSLRQVVRDIYEMAEKHFVSDPPRETGYNFQAPHLMGVDDKGEPIMTVWVLECRACWSSTGQGQKGPWHELGCPQAPVDSTPVTGKEEGTDGN